MSECENQSQKKKKKGAMKIVRPVTKEVVLLEKYRLCLPKNRQRAQLKDEKRIIKLEFKRNMSPDDVKRCIRAGFNMNVPNLIFLEIKNGRLLVSSNQQPNGHHVIDKRGALYICEHCDEVGDVMCMLEC